MPSCLRGATSTGLVRWKRRRRHGPKTRGRSQRPGQRTRPRRTPGKRGSAGGSVTALRSSRLILVWDHLAGHRRDALVRWRFAHGSRPLYTPLGGSWLNLAESLQRILVRRVLAGQHPPSPQHSIDWLEQTAAGWNQEPTPFVWNGKRRERRQRARLRRLAGSGAAVLAIASSLQRDPLRPADEIYNAKAKKSLSA